MATMISVAGAVEMGASPHLNQVIILITHAVTVALVIYPSIQLWEIPAVYQDAKIRNMWTQLMAECMTIVGVHMPMKHRLRVCYS